MNEQNTYFNYWAKCSRTNRRDFHLFPFHSLDVAAVGCFLLDPASPRTKYLAKQSGLSIEFIRYLFVLLLMIHDLGKLSKRFQALVPEIFAVLFPGRKFPGEYITRHDTMGHVLWRKKVFQQLTEKNPNLAEILDLLAESSFGHHGMPPEVAKCGGHTAFVLEEFFDSQDVQAALGFVSDCLEILGPTPSVPENWRRLIPGLKTLSWQFAGLTVLCDWLGSSVEYFPYSSSFLPITEYWHAFALPQARRVVHEGFGHSSRPSPYENIHSLFPFIEQPTPLQKWAHETSLASGPKLFILEDVTGAGKTEAALILAHRLMAQGDAEGLYFGLPTMATANSIYQRLRVAYRRLFEPNSIPSLVLAHGARHLSKDFSDSVRPIPGAPTQDQIYGQEESASSFCREWLADSSKKSLLAEVGVGTLDQALLSVLPARHQSLRLLGLYRKLLVVDEIYAYDPYMARLLEGLLKEHARQGGSAILLSATLPLGRKAQFITSFRSGLQSANAREMQAGSASEAFPVASQAAACSSSATALSSRSEVSRTVLIKFVNHYENVIGVIQSKARQGHCVCWIRNTVRDAVKTYHDLIQQGVSPSRIDLFHSRFAMIDRIRIEEKVLRQFGKLAGPSEREGRIIVATQVVEQSLDLDFDEMFSDLAPIDLLVQRAGRLQRHIRSHDGVYMKGKGVKDGRKPAVLHIFAPEFQEHPKKGWLAQDFRGTALVYPHIGQLWLTYRALNQLGQWTMPDDARHLIEAVYREDAQTEIPKSLQWQEDKATGEDQGKQGGADLNTLNFAKGYRRTSAKAEQWDGELKIKTRIGEATIDVVLAVCEDGRLLPFAEVDHHSWELSRLSLPKRLWTDAHRAQNLEYSSLIESEKRLNPKLKYSEICVVPQRSNAALNAPDPNFKNYHPRLGWGSFQPQGERE